MAGFPATKSGTVKTTDAPKYVANTSTTEQSQASVSKTSKTPKTVDSGSASLKTIRNGTTLTGQSQPQKSAYNPMEDIIMTVTKPKTPQRVTVNAAFDAWHNTMNTLANERKEKEAQAKAEAEQKEYKQLQAELDRIDASRAYVTTTEQSDELEKERKQVVERMRELGGSGTSTEEQQRSNSLENTKLAIDQGLTQADHRIAQTVDWLFGGIAKEGKALLNATLQSVNPEWGFEDEDPFITKYNKRGEEVLAANEQEAQSRIAEGTLNKNVWQYAPQVVAAVPDAVLALMSGGSTAAAQASTKALTTAQPIAAAVKNMASSPMWLSSFAQSAGSSYNSAIAEGTTEEQASLYALLNGFANATIEVGGGDEALGGMQKLPQQIQEAIKRGDSNLILKWVKNIASEAGEEVTQGLTEKALRGVYTNDVPLYSATDENAVINPARAKEEAIGGAIVSAILGGGQMALQAGANGGVAKALPSKQQSTHKTGEDILMETVLGENAKKSAQQPQVSTETQGDIPAPVTAQEAKQGGFDELNSASNVNDAETKAESMTWEEKARAEAKEQAWAEYEDAVGRYWRENPFATSIPKTLENGARWVEDRVNAILKKNAANGELDDYVRSVNKLEAKTPDMTERATRNKADAFSAAPHDSAIEARQAEWNRFGKTKVDKAATEAPVNETDYHRGRESYYSDRAEPKGLRVGKQYIEEFGPKKYDPAQDKDLPSTKLDYIIDSALRAESNGIDARAAQALDMLRNGTSPSDVYSKLGLVVKANGDITDGIGGDVLWRSTKKGEKNGQAGSDAGNNSVREEYRSAEAGVSVNVGRGVESVGSGAQKNARSWETLDTNEREAARELIQRKIDAADSDEAYDMREVYGDDSELARAIYKSYTEGDISLEQRWTSYFGDMGKLADELDAALGSKAAAAQRTAKADTTQSRSANTDENGTAADTGSDTTGRTYVDKNGNEYDPKTGYTTRAAEDVNDERDAHVTDDLYYTLRAEDKLTLDNAKEWARLQQEERNRRERQEDIPDDVAWQDAEAVYGSKSHEAINDAVTRATEHETFLEKSEFLNSLNNDSKREAVAAEVAGFKSKLKGLGDGHVSFDEFSDYYGALKNNSTLGDLYSERVNEQVQQAKEYMNEACENPSPYTVDKFRRTATNAVQMATHYIEKAGRVREQLNKLNANVRKNGKKPFETERNPSFVERAKSAAQKVAAGYEHWQIMPRQMFQKIDGFDKWGGGEGYKIAQEIDKATALEQRVFVESQGFFTDVMKNRKAYAAFSTGKTKSGVYVDGRQLSMDEAVTMYMAIRTMGGSTAYRAQNVDGFAIKNGKANPAIVNVEHISELYEDLRRAISKDPVAKSYVQAFANMATHNGKAAQEVKSRIDGITVEMLGEGMYFPLSYTSATEANQNWDSESKRDFGLPDIGLMRERTRAAGGYINIAPITEVTDSYIRQIANYTAWGELADTFSVMDKMHTFGTSSLTDTVKRYMGDEYGKWMQNYINDVQNTNVERAKVKGGFWRNVTRNFQSAVLVGNPGTPFKQKGSMWLAMS